MRQDMRERERQLRKLHQSIDKYEQSPNTKKTVQKAAIDLSNAIQYKYQKSEPNRNYIFPRTHADSSDEEDQCMEVEIVNLRKANDFISHDLSIADEPESNHVYVSQKTVMQLDKPSPFYKHAPGIKSKLKIKVVKKKIDQSIHIPSKLDRLKTDYVHANFSSISSAKDGSKFYKNESCSKSKILTGTENIMKRFKIESKTEHNQSTKYTHITMKTDYSQASKKQGKQNVRVKESESSQRHFISQNSSKRLNLSSSKSNLKIQYAKKKKMEQNPSISLLQTQNKLRITNKSTQNLKVIKLGHGSVQKISVKCIHV